MIEDRTQDVQAMRERVAKIADYLHLDAKRTELAALEERAAAPGFWDDQSSAQQVMAQAAGLRDEISSYESIVSALDDLEVANELAVAEDDEDLATEAAGAVRVLLHGANAPEINTWFTGEFDHG